MIGLSHFLYLSLFLFAMGLVCVVIKRNVVHILMGIELILNASSLNMIAFSHYIKPQGTADVLSGQIFSIFIIVLAAAEAVVALAILFCVFSSFRTPKVDKMTELKE
jgi:NADH:ubiquinone oxidoreductase subunit K